MKRQPSPAEEWPLHLQGEEQAENCVTLAGVQIQPQQPPALTLWQALELGQDDAAIHLIESGKANVDERGGAYGSTPIGWAAFTGRTSLARDLLALGARVDIPAAMGSTALHMATWNGDNVELLKLLLDAKADPSIRNASRETALEQAQVLHQLEVSASVGEHCDMSSWRARWGKGEAGRSGVIGLLEGCVGAKEQKGAVVEEESSACDSAGAADN